MGGTVWLSQVGNGSGEPDFLMHENNLTNPIEITSPRGNSCEQIAGQGTKPQTTQEYLADLTGDATWEDLDLATSGDFVDLGLRPEPNTTRETTQQPL